MAPGDGERARQERPLVLAPAPALGRREHGELAGIGRRPVRVGDREHDVGAVAPPPDDREPPPRERGERAVAAHDVTAPAPLARWISWSERTSGTTPWRSPAIARAAAIPPVIVVMQGIPRAIAARRIS